MSTPILAPAARSRRDRGEEVVRFDAVTVRRSAHGVSRVVLDRIDWVVRSGEHWGIVGPNGAGKTTLVRLASAQIRPSEGVAMVLGERLGRVPLQRLRERIGLVEPALGRRFGPERTVLDIVCSGVRGTIVQLAASSGAERERARDALALVGVGGLSERAFATCSEGERSRVLLARALVTDARMLVLDEPAAGLDLAGRELLLQAFEEAVGTRGELTTLTVTHHIEELPPGITHALLLRDGAVVAAGLIADALTAETLSACFGLSLRLEHIGGRLFPHLVAGGSA